MDFEEMQLRDDNLNGALLSRAATKTTEEILQQYPINHLFRFVLGLLSL